MKTFREDPDGEASQEASRQHRREVFALKMMALNNEAECDIEPISRDHENGLASEGTLKIAVQGMTPEIHNALIGAYKWIIRIHQRKNELPLSFLDGCDPKPLADKIASLLEE